MGCKDCIMTKGTVLEIQRMSTEDGPGIRTTVFLKGCPLKCIWCHNPESILMKPQVHWVGSRCIGCNICIDSCPNDALKKGEKGIEIDRNICKGCGTCANECPSTAMELLGHEWEAKKLVDELIKDRAFFETSGGGITVSGGEPTMQAEFVLEVLKMLKEKGIHTALDTCGLCREETIAMLLPYANLVLFDLKIMDSKLHKKFTGSPNEKILESLLFIRDMMKENGSPKELWIRTPIIPGATDNEKLLREIGRYIAENVNDVVTRWDLCAFNNLCRDKYTRLGLDWTYHDSKPLKKETMERLAETARNSGVKPAIVQWSGATRLEEND
jgi:pyruvate formate lyase activating enzyme